MAEKSESMLFLIIGIIAISLSIFFYSYLRTNFYKGAAIPLLVIGLIQSVVGYTVYSRSDRQRIEMVYAYDMDPAKLKNEELPRMQTVNRQFLIYKGLETGFIIAGLLLIFLYKNVQARNFWFGLGITLTIQAVLMLAADYFAEKRAAFYTGQLEKFTSQKSI